MFTKRYLLIYLRYALLAAVMFCIPMFVFVMKNDYRNAWLLYLGNALFLVAIAFFTLTFNRSRGENASTQNMVAAGHIVTIMGIVISAIVALIALFIAVPDLLSSNPKAGAAMIDAPAQTGTGKTNGLVFILFLDIFVGNLCAGSFPSIMLPYAAKRDQTKDRKSEVLNN